MIEVTPKFVEVSLESLGDIGIGILLVLTSSIGGYFAYNELNLPSDEEYNKR